MEKQLSEKLPRVEVVDALRGFAVMAILLVHSLEPVSYTHLTLPTKLEV